WGYDADVLRLGGTGGAAVHCDDKAESEQDWRQLFHESHTVLPSSGMCSLVHDCPAGDSARAGTTPTVRNRKAPRECDTAAYPRLGVGRSDRTGRTLRSLASLTRSATRRRA